MTPNHTPFEHPPAGDPIGPDAGTARAAVARVLPHVTGLILIAVAAVALGRPYGWLGFGAAIGPPIGAGLAAGLGRRQVVSWREAFAFGLVAAFLTGGGWVALELLPKVHGIFILLWPVALLGFMLGAVNFVAVSLSRGWRAARRQPLDYPWIPRPLARAVGARADLRAP